MLVSNSSLTYDYAMVYSVLETSWSDQLTTSTVTALGGGRP